MKIAELPRVPVLSVVALTVFLLLLQVVSPNPDGKYYFYDVYGPASSETWLASQRMRRNAGVGDALEDENASGTQNIVSSEPSTPVTSIDVDEVNSNDDDDDDEVTSLHTDAIDIPNERINDTVTQGSRKEGIANITTDNHKYYRPTFVKFENAWVDLEGLNGVQEHAMLSQSYRRAATVNLKFQFPFYGHNVTNITIATGGFLYVGDFVHSWLAATQYIAPLMANFDTRLGDKDAIKYADTGTSFIVEWSNVYLQVAKSSETASNYSTLSSSSTQVTDAHSKVEVKHEGKGPFSFQVSLKHTGDIIFAYKTVPVAITEIADEEHPVKVGMSDAYIIDRTIFLIKPKTIYEYHRVSMKSSRITNYTAIYFQALPTCNSRFWDCVSCMNANDIDGKPLNCMWCPRLGRCSDGMDRNRQDWLRKDCDTSHVKGNSSSCFYLPTRQSGKPSMPLNDEDSTTTTTISSSSSSSSSSGDVTTTKVVEKKGHYKQAGIATVSILVLLFASTLAWFGYAYFFPHSWSGQLLIKYRPTRWQWRRGEPRYTAASIHM